MKLFTRIITGIIILIVVAVAVAYLLPRHVSAERDIVIEAEPEKIFPLVNDLKAFNEWSPWTKIDPDMKINYSGPESGVGQKSEWQSHHRSVGNGSQQIVASQKNKRVETVLDFGSQGMASAMFELVPDGDSTKVIWRFRSDLGMNPVSRYFGLMIDDWVGADYEKGLVSLKTRVEAQQ